MIQETQFNLQFVWEVTRKHFRYIAGALVLALAGSFIFTMPFFFPPQFKSSTVIFPTSPDRFDGTRIFTRGQDFYVFGGADDLERLIEITKSEDVAMQVIDSLDLWKAYKVDKNSLSPKFNVLQEFNGNVSIIKADGNGLEIIVYDEDPKRAADIVNTIVYFSERSMKRMLQETKNFIGEMFYTRTQQLQKEIRQSQDSITKLRVKYNVLSDETQTEMLVEQILLAEGNLASEKARHAELQKHYNNQDSVLVNSLAKIKAHEQRVRSLTNNASGSSINLEKYREGLDKIDALENHLYLLTTQLNDMQDRYHQATAYQGNTFSTISQVQKAMPSDRKAKPVRWIIVLTSLLLTGFAAIATALLIEGIRLNNATKA